MFSVGTNVGRGGHECGFHGQIVDYLPVVRLNWIRLHMQSDLLQGTLNMLILQVLSRSKANGYEIAKAIENRSGDALHVDHGSLYPALRRLESNGWIRASWETSPTNRKARYYALTSAGRKQVEIERSRWRAAALAVTRVMREA